MIRGASRAGENLLFYLSEAIRSLSRASPAYEMIRTMEIEAKYRVESAEITLVAALRALGHYRLEPAPAPELQENVYYDTADGRLAAARYGLRVRRVADRTLTTLKGPAAVGVAGLHRRAEHEFPGADPQPLSWPPGAARELALALTGGAPLVAIAAVSTERQILHAARDGLAVAEFALDRGVLRGGGHERPFTELEIELLPAGEPADIDALARALAAHITLVPEPLSKLQRALALREGPHP
jgi:inorganic triphosphatase YgiF